MAKKNSPAPAQGKTKSAPAKVAVAAAQDLKSTVTAIHEERSADLLTLLKETEEIVRSTSFLEAQTARQADLLEKMKIEKDAIDKQHQKISADNAQLKAELDALNKSLSAETSSNRDLGKKSASVKSEISKLETQNEKLSIEIKNLEKSADRLKSDVERLETIRKEYVERISKFREMREDLIR